MPDNISQLVSQLSAQLATENSIARRLAAVESQTLDPQLLNLATSGPSQNSVNLLQSFVTPDSGPNIAAFAAGFAQSQVDASRNAAARLKVQQQEQERQANALAAQLERSRVQREDRLSLQQAEIDLRTSTARQREAQIDARLARENEQIFNAIPRAERVAAQRTALEQPQLEADLVNLQIDNSRATLNATRAQAERDERNAAAAVRNNTRAAAFNAAKSTILSALGAAGANPDVRTDPIIRNLVVAEMQRLGEQQGIAFADQPEFAGDVELAVEDILSTFGVRRGLERSAQGKTTGTHADAVAAAAALASGQTTTPTVPSTGIGNNP